MHCENIRYEYLKVQKMCMLLNRRKIIEILQELEVARIRLR